LILPAAIFLFVPASSISQSSVRRQDLGTPLDATRLQAEHRRALGEEIEKLFRDDQAEGPDNLMPDPQRQAWLLAHEKRILRMREIVRTESLETVPDLFNAASMLQHGIAPNDFLTAHVLYETAALKGSMSARWLAAGALDRYLLRTDHPAIFDLTLGGPNLITDELRKFHCVLPAAEQEADSPNRLRQCALLRTDLYNN